MCVGDDDEDDEGGGGGGGDTLRVAVFGWLAVDSVDERRPVPGPVLELEFVPGEAVAVAGTCNDLGEEEPPPPPPVPPPMELTRSDSCVWSETAADTDTWTADAASDLVRIHDDDSAVTPTLLE